MTGRKSAKECITDRAGHSQCHHVLDIMRDNADNEIVSGGGYGTYDYQGPKSKEPTPAIP